MGFCRAMVSSCDSRLVASWNLIKSVCMFSWGIG